MLMPSEKVGFNRCKGEEDTSYLVAGVNNEVGNSRIAFLLSMHRA